MRRVGADRLGLTRRRVGLDVPADVPGGEPEEVVITAESDLKWNEDLIMNMSSGLGSIANNRRGSSVGYRASKAALNMLTRTLAADLAVGKDGGEFYLRLGEAF